MTIVGGEETGWGFALGEMAVGKVPDAGGTFWLLLCGLGTLGGVRAATRRE
jgi:hypothetical protein